MGLTRMLRDDNSLLPEFERYPFFNKDFKTRSHSYGSPQLRITSNKHPIIERVRLPRNCVSFR